MQAWQFVGTGRPLELVTLPDPEPGPGKVVVDIKASGLCHSDVAAIDDPAWMEMIQFVPIVMGHELAGVVSAVGEGVTTLQVGDRVGVHSGLPNALGYQRHGAYAEKVEVFEESAVKIPDSIDYVQAAAATDSGVVAHHAVVGIGKLQPGEKVGIIGIGGLGQIGARIAVNLGAEVYAAEINEDAWELARSLAVKDVQKDIREYADQELDLIVDFAGFSTTTAGAIEVIRNQGRVVQVGMGKLEASIPISPFIMKQVQLLGSMGGDSTDLRAVYDMYKAGTLEPTTSTTTFDKIPEGLDARRRGEVRGRLIAVLDD